MEKENKLVINATIEVDQIEAFIKKLFGDNFFHKEPIKTPEGKKLNRAQAAKLCGVTYHTFGVWTKQGRFVERGFGRKKFFYEHEIIQCLTNGRKNKADR